MAQLPAYLTDMQREIERYGREYGLDFWDIEFEILDYKKMQEVAAFGGFPVRYPHWRFGMEFEHLTKSHIYGLRRSTRWSSTTTRPTPTCSRAIRSSTRRWSWRTCWG